MKINIPKTNNVSVVDLVQNIIEQAALLGVSDIHLDPQASNLRVRFRVDGILRDVESVDKILHSELISRIKILAGLRTDEHQAPQDGRFRITLSKKENLDVRVSIAPTYHGENAVLRLLSDKAQDISLYSLGFSEENYKKILAAIRKPHGLILVTGPTGSGKTTTLYSLLKILNTKEVSIVTIEDPIEYAMEGLEQIQVNPRTNLTFAQGLRSILRQDPNIIMVGEIRDSETAAIAVNAALTGHLVLSTLHTNDAATTLPRLLDMKVEAFLIASTVSLVISQRLVRKICEHCRVIKQLSEHEVKSLTTILLEENVFNGRVFYQGQGCLMCDNTGYSGRVGIHEILLLDFKIREAILQKAQADQIKKISVLSGNLNIIQDGLLKVQAGITTIEEVIRVFYE
jgi:type IV pilus assembly protein PilB